MAFTCWYAVSGKKNGIAGAGSSVTTAFHRPLTPASNIGPLAAGLSGVCGRSPGSGVVVVVGAGVAGGRVKYERPCAALASSSTSMGGFVVGCLVWGVPVPA